MVNSSEKLYMEKLGKFHPTPRQRQKWVKEKSEHEQCFVIMNN